MFSKIKILVVSVILTGCVSTGNDASDFAAQLETVNSNIAGLEKSLSQQIASSCRQDSEKLAAKIAESISATKSAKAASAPVELESVSACPKDDGSAQGDGKQIFGGVETITLVKEEVSIDARVDTGAETSSLGVYKLGRFERDGKKWVKFSLSAAQDAPVFKYPVYDTTRIKQESDEQAERRLEIKIGIAVGGKKYRKQVFNLADRSHLDYQALVGRNFLRDIAIVDVSAIHLLKRE